MAPINHPQIESVDSNHFLLLLSSPFDSVGAVQELLEIDLDTNNSQLSTKLDEISDENVLEAHFGCPGRAVLLDKKQALVVMDHASRHRAIFSINLSILEEDQYRRVRIAGLGINYPVWVFVSSGVADSCDWSGEIARPASLASCGMMPKGSETSLQNSKRQGDPARAATDTHPERKRLRPAQDVLNRLRHDEEFNAEDYQVVYEDRFLGEVVLDLSDWVSDTTDELFIPQHRIVRFERKWDGAPVWSRRDRIDVLFGGMSDAAQSCSGTAYRILTSEQLMRFEASLVVSHQGCVRKAVIEFQDRPGERANGLAYPE